MGNEHIGTRPGSMGGGSYTYSYAKMVNHWKYETAFPIHFSFGTH